jgi:Gas vesicle protein
LSDLLDPEADASLLDLVDNALTKGVVVSGDVVLGLAGVALVYLRLSAVLCAVESLLRKAGR